MEPFYQEPSETIYNGDALTILKTLPDESVQMCMCSPPYWGLRNYAGGADIVWGGEENCEHEWGDKLIVKRGHPGDKTTLVGTQTASLSKSTNNQGAYCSLCGAWRGQLGLEPTPSLYCEHLMMIFREVKRVLRKDGSFYLNIGDTYGGSGSLGGDFKDGKGDNYLRPYAQAKLTPKCMTLIPERVMFAMLEDDWILRNKNIWHKPNSMPGSQKDRFTSSWEYLYFFVKNNNTILWRNSETGEWRDTRPTKEENYPWGGMYQHIETGKFSWTKPPKNEKDYWVKYQPLWMGFDYYFDLDAIRIPHKTLSLERYQRGVNLDRPAVGKSAQVGPLQQYKRAPGWFQEMFPPDQDYKGKFNDLFGHGPNPQSFNLRVRDVKRGKGGVSAQGGELKASEKEIEEYEYPEKHHGSSMSNQESLHSERRKDVVEIHRQKEDGRIPKDQLSRPPEPEVDPGRAFHVKGKNPGDVLTTRQESIVGHFEEKGSGGHYLYGGLESEEGRHEHPKGKNPGDYWDITTQPSSICVCPKCEAVFPRYTKVCPSCNVEGVVGHFAPYPVALCEMPIKASTRVGDVVLDPLAGGGNTGVAAKKLGRKCILIDCVKEYCIMARHKLSKVDYQPELIANLLGRDD